MSLGLRVATWQAMAAYPLGWKARFLPWTFNLPRGPPGRLLGREELFFQVVLSIVDGGPLKACAINSSGAQLCLPPPGYAGRLQARPAHHALQTDTSVNADGKEATPGHSPGPS